MSEKTDERNGGELVLARIRGGSWQATELPNVWARLLRGAPASQPAESASCPTPSPSRKPFSSTAGLVRHEQHHAGLGAGDLLERVSVEVADRTDHGAGLHPLPALTSASHQPPAFVRSQAAIG